MFSFQLHADLPTITVTASLVLLLTVFLLSRLLPRSTPLNTPPRPPLAPLPLAAHTPHCRDTLLSHLSRYGSVFRLPHPTLGTSSVYVGDALAIQDVLRQPGAFGVGQLHVQSAGMWRMSARCAAWFAHSGGQDTLQHSARLFSGERLGVLQQRFVRAVARGLDAVEVGEADLCELSGGLLFRATMEALFTPSFASAHRVFRAWDGQLASFTAGTPSPEAVAARDSMYSAVEEQLEQHRDECSAQIRDLFDELRQTHAQVHQDAVAVVLRTAWLASTQSPHAAAWLLCILAQQPAKLHRVRDELRKLKNMAGESTEQLVRRPEWLREVKLPLLDQLVNEVLRVYCAQTVPRLCTAEAVVRVLEEEGGRVREVLMRQGDVVQLMFWNVHSSRLNPQVRSPLPALVWQSDS